MQNVLKTEPTNLIVKEENKIYPRNLQNRTKDSLDYELQYIKLDEVKKPVEIHKETVKEYPPVKAQMDMETLQEKF